MYQNRKIFYCCGKNWIFYILNYNKYYHVSGKKKQAIEFAKYDIKRLFL